MYWRSSTTSQFTLPPSRPWKTPSLGRNRDTAAPVVWDAETGEKLPAVEAGSPVTTVAFSPDGLVFVGGGDKVYVDAKERSMFPDLLVTSPAMHTPAGYQP